MKHTRSLRLTRETLGELSTAELVRVGAGNELVATTPLVYSTDTMDLACRLTPTIADVRVPTSQTTCTTR